MIAKKRKAKLLSVRGIARLAQVPARMVRAMIRAKRMRSKARKGGRKLYNPDRLVAELAKKKAVLATITVI